MKKAHTHLSKQNLLSNTKLGGKYREKENTYMQKEHIHITFQDLGISQNPHHMIQEDLSLTIFLVGPDLVHGRLD